jgi:hypothetical protein
VSATAGFARDEAACVGQPACYLTLDALYNLTALPFPSGVNQFVVAALCGVPPSPPPPSPEPPPLRACMPHCA